MDSIYWVELYFRSVKRNKVLGSITKYLIQNKRVCIPYVGTFEIIQEAPHWDFSEKLFTAPVFIVKHSSQEVLTDHQTLYLASDEHIDKHQTVEALENFGAQLKSRIEKEPFEWDGFGKLSYNASSIIFEAFPISLSGLKPVPAERVIRENVVHNVLVGDQEMTSQQITEALQQPVRKRSVGIIIAWIVLALALIAIAIILYLQHFAPGASGLRINATEPFKLLQNLF